MLSKSKIEEISYIKQEYQVLCDQQWYTDYIIWNNWLTIGVVIQQDQHGVVDSIPYSGFEKF